MEPRHICQLIRVLRESDKAQSDMTFPMLEALLLIAERGEISQKDAGKALGIDPGVFSRVVNSLAEQVRQNDDVKPGRKLINTYENPQDFRSKMLSLTERGKTLIKQIKAIE